MSQNPLAAVRERISDLKDAAAVYFGTHEGEVMEWAANALEAVLEATDSVTPQNVIDEPWSTDSLFQRGLLRAKQSVRDALTRVTATTEGAR